MEKDWKGNFNSLTGTMGATGHRNSERQQDDFYATDPRAIDLIYPYYPIPLNVWEPACGQGHLSRRLEELGHNVVSTDLVDRGYGTPGIDFLNTYEVPEGVECIITNPPYKYSTQFVEHALDILEPGMPAIMLLKTISLEGKERYSKLFSKGYLKAMYQFVGRVLCAKNGDFDGVEKVGSMVAYAWYVFTKEHNESKIFWIPC
jgi:hypothetical protein